jgi:haloalkane dehalogenase
MRPNVRALQDDDRDTECMRRRDFLRGSSAVVAAATLGVPGFAKQPKRIDAEWYRRSRRFASLPMSRVAYVEHGRGPAALFVHGFPLNGYQWRGALERLAPYRRCIAPDVMGLGYTETPENQEITPENQVAMLAALLDSLHIDSVDLVANDSGGLVSQLFVARHPDRVRTLLLANCDVDENNPPAAFVPMVNLAKKGLFTEKVLVPALNNKEQTRSAKGFGGQTYSYPERFADETIEMYFRPLVETPLRKAQVDHYAVALGINVLVPIRENLRQWKRPARIVWGMKDTIFAPEWADWLDHNLPGSRGVRKVEDAMLFFPEEMPDVIAEEAKNLWGVGLQ